MTDTSSTWFITGTSRGIGLQFVKQLTEDPSAVVIASCRNPSGATELNALKESAKGRLHILQLDVTDPESITAAASEAASILQERGLDYLLNNAAVNPGDDDAFNVTVDRLNFAFQHNVVGPALIAQAFVPLLQKGNRKVIMNMTSGLASIGLDIGPKCCAYSISKGALNMLSYKQARANPDLIPFVIDPGWVKTKMGGQGAFLEPVESVTGLLKFLRNASLENSGKFYNYKGEELPW